MKRVINAAPHLKGKVEEGKSYYIGFGISNLTDIAKSSVEIQQLIDGKKTSFLVTGKKGALKENIKGKIVRKQPETKESIWKHIHYYSKRFERDIDYDRQFNIWEKMILHKYELSLEAAKTPQHEIVLHFPIFKMLDEESHFLKAAAAMNMSIALGTYFMFYDSKFEPIVPVTKYENRKMLPSGNYSIVEKLEIIERNIDINNNNDEVGQGNSYRFAILKEYKLIDVTMGIGGFNEYLLFEFAEYDLAILENLKTGNATYIFKLSTFDKNVELDKQRASKDPSFIARVVHGSMEEWLKQVGKYFR